ncbi:MAG: hypothetical protein IJC08_00850 [Bacteroidaceae bacterium]|nr:hypothetical protein [Bacteroidaceae bacterium]
MQAVDNLLAALMGRKDCFPSNLFAVDAPKCNYNFPLDKMFLDYFAEEAGNDSLRALSMMATLYLSVLHCGFPQSLLRSSVTFLRENISLPSFDCTHYERLYARLTTDNRTTLPLFEDVGKIVLKEVSRLDIYDAFDFITNGY